MGKASTFLFGCSAAGVGGNDLRHCVCFPASNTAILNVRVLGTWRANYSFCRFCPSPSVSRGNSHGQSAMATRTDNATGEGMIASAKRQARRKRHQSQSRLPSSSPAMSTTMISSRLAVNRSTLRTALDVGQASSVDVIRRPRPRRQLYLTCLCFVSSHRRMIPPSHSRAVTLWVASCPNRLFCEQMPCATTVLGR